MKRLIVLLAGFLTACATDGSIVKSEYADSSYRSWNFNTRLSDGQLLPYTVWFKPYNEGGLLGVCGVITTESSSVHKQLISAMFQDAGLFLNDTAIGKGWFLSVRDPRDRRASCMKTTLAWNASFNGQVRLRTEGGYGRVFF